LAVKSLDFVRRPPKVWDGLLRTIRKPAVDGTATEERMSTIAGQTRKPWTTPAYHYIRSTDKLPSTDAAYADDDPLCRVKLFNPTGAGTWFIAGFDPETGLCFGVADLFERELGDFDLNELIEIRGPVCLAGREIGRLPIERDLHWSPQRVSALLSGE
jgi:hypothetical protein